MSDSHTYHDMSDSHTYHDMSDSYTYHDMSDSHTYHDMSDSHTYHDTSATPYEHQVCQHPFLFGEPKDEFGRYLGEANKNILVSEDVLLFVLFNSFFQHDFCCLYITFCPSLNSCLSHVFHLAYL